MNNQSADAVNQGGKEAVAMALEALKSMLSTGEREHTPTHSQLERTREAIAALSSLKDQQAQPVEPELCPACGGSGESTYLSDNGPDARDIPCNCPHCNGGQTLEDAYNGVCKLLEAETKRASVLSSELYWKEHGILPIDGQAHGATLLPDPCDEREGTWIALSDKKPVETAQEQGRDDAN